MNLNALQSKRSIRWAFFFLLWTGIGVAFASQFYLGNSKRRIPVSWGQALNSSLGDWYVFALLSIPAMWLARRFRFEVHNWGRMVLTHGFLSVIFSYVYILLRAAVAVTQSGLAANAVSYSEAFWLVTKTFPYNIWVYWMIIAVAHAFDYYRKFHERELRTQELETRLARAKLQALQMQLNPHFLFNTLHTISALMHKDIDAADRMVMKLSELLRLALDNTDAHEVPLRQELAFLERYLEIEKTRFRERLTVEMEIAPETLDAQVPNLVLQPLVENALRHGIERHARPGKIVLRAHEKNGQIELQVQDNGAGLPSNGQWEEGIGLSNTRSRLQQLYGKSQEFRLENVPTGGLLARVLIPYHVLN
jgi:two-component system LytT family sensor kinase